MSKTLLETLKGITLENFQDIGVIMESVGGSDFNYSFYFSNRIKYLNSLELVT